jgi:cell division protein FtsZ
MNNLPDIIIINFIAILFLYILYKGLKSIYQDFKNIYYLKIKTYFIKKKQEQHSENKKIIGIGGGGSNIVESLSKQYESLIINSDKRALEQKKVKNKIHLEKPDNLGCGANEKCGFSLITNEVLSQIDKFIDKNLSLTLIATLGGGVGSGSTKAIAKHLSNKNILVKCILVKPFSWEGSKKINRANETIDFLNQLNNVSIIEIENDELKSFEHLSMKESFSLLNNKINLLI